MLSHCLLSVRMALARSTPARAMIANCEVTPAGRAARSGLGASRAPARAPRSSQRLRIDRANSLFSRSNCCTCRTGESAKRIPDEVSPPDDLAV